MKKLKIKVKYAILACTLQDDFENLMAKLSFLELFPLTPPRKSLKEDVKEQACQDLTWLPRQCFCTGGEGGQPKAWRQPRLRERRAYPSPLCPSCPRNLTESGKILIWTSQISSVW